MEMVTKLVTDAMGKVEIPAVGNEEDVTRAKELIGNEGKVYAALKVPQEVYDTSCKEYCFMCPVPCLCVTRMLANQTLKKTLYIVTDKTVKVHVDPLDPPFSHSAFKRNIPDLDINDVKDIAIVEKGGTCFDPKKKRGIAFGDSGVEFYVSEPEQLKSVLEKAKQAKEMAEGGAAKVQALEEAAKRAKDEGVSNPSGGN